MKSIFRIGTLFSVWLFGVSAFAQVVYPGRPEIIGNEEIVFDYSTDACCTEDIPDGPAQAFRDANGKIQLIAIHKIAYRMIGNDFNSLYRDCANGPIFTSDESDRPETYNNQEWLAGVYTLDGRTIYSIVHNEYKPEGDANWAFSWYNTLTFAVSTDTGRTYTQPEAPAHFLAGIPYKYAYGSPMGIFGGSKPVYNPDDGYYYALVHLEKYQLQDWGVGVMRTRTLDAPDSWRGWDGTGFNVHFVDPYNETVDDPANHILAPVSRNNIGKMCESLTFNTYFNAFMAVGFHVKYDASLGRNVYGFYYSLSSDLIHWSSPILIYESPVNGWQVGGIYYPAIIDHADTSRNFERPGQEAYLYFTRWNSGTYDRDLVRVPIRFKKNVVTGFMVNSTGDREAKNVGDGTAFTGFTNSAGDPEVTLRSALQEINASPDSEFVFTVDFNIPGEGIHTIQVNKFLPDLTHPAIINGYSQPGASPNTLAFNQGNNAKILVELDGSGSGGAFGFSFLGGNVHLKGLALYNFGSGVEISGGGENSVEGCFLGLNANGEPQGSSIGITIQNSARNTIGGENPEAMNVLTGQVTIDGSSARENQVIGNYIGTDATGAKTVGSGMVVLQNGACSNQIGKKTAPNLISGSYRGVEITGAGTDSNRVAGNLMGVDKTGSIPLRTGLLGVYIGNGPKYNEIGGTGQGNVIGSWDGQAVVLTGAGTEFNSVQGNFMGTDTTGTQQFDNGTPVVQLSDRASNNLIGGTQPGEGNVIAHNSGIAVGLGSDAGTGNAILGNSIYGNGFGIDLFPWGVTENDSLDADTGPNNYQNFPVLMAVRSEGGQTRIRGRLDSQPNTTYRVEFFSNSRGDLLGFGQGEHFIGFQNVTTNDAGFAEIDATFPVPVEAESFVTATATDPQNNTSEFSNAVKVANSQIFPEIHVSPETLTFALHPTQMLDDSIVIRNTGTQTLRWTAEASARWMRLSATSDTIAPGGRNQMTVTVDPAGLPIGTITGFVVIYSSDVTHPADTVQVRMTIIGETRVDVFPDRFAWTLHSGETQNDTLVISNSGEMPFDFRLNAGADWLTILPDSGHLEVGRRDTIFLTVRTQGLPEGHFSDWIQLELVGSGQPPINLKVELTVETGGGAAVFSVEPDSIVEALPVEGRMVRKLTVRNSGAQALKWWGRIQQEWADVLPDSGEVAPSGVDSVFVQIHAAGLPPGDYSTRLDFETNDPSRPHVPVPIRIHVFVPEAGVVVVPDSFEITLPPEAVGRDTLRIENHSDKTLNWTIETKEGWVRFAPGSGTIPPKGDQKIAVAVDSKGKAPGDYFGGLVIRFHDPQNPDHFVPIHLSVTGAPNLPQIQVFPERIVHQYRAGQTIHDTLRIANKGSASLNWNLFSTAPWLHKTPEKGAIPASDSTWVLLTILTENLSGSNYSDTLFVRSDDPVKPVIRIPVTLELLTDVSFEGNSRMPDGYHLFQNSPNPFNPTTTITYYLPIPSDVEIRVYDFRGSEVKTLLHGRQGAGLQRIQWDATNKLNRPMPSGIYFLQMCAKSRQKRFTQTKKMILLH